MLLAISCSSAAAPTVEPLAPPPIDPRLESLSQGEIELQAGARSAQDIDPLALARRAGTPPTCAEFVFLFSWRTSGSQELAFRGNRQGGQFDIGRGAQGQASISGCVLLQALNNSDRTVEGRLRYIVARPRP